MKSIAIWYSAEGNRIIEDNEAQIHFNYWKLPKRSFFYRYIQTNNFIKSRYLNNGHFRFLDIGVRLKYNEHLQSVNFYFPFKLNSSDCQDLGKKITSDKELLSAVFNDNLGVSSNVSNTIYTIAREGQNTEFYFYELGSNNFEINDINEGSILKIDIKAAIKKITDSQDLYFRFRIYSKGLKDFSYIEKLTNSFIQSAFSKVELVDFRLNNIRDINPKLLESSIHKDKFFNLRMVHFFFMGASSEENIYSNQEAKNCRLLEQYRWDHYIDDIDYDKNKKILAYHWCEKARKEESSEYKYFTDFNLLFKTVFSEVSWFEVFKYIFVLIIIGVFINFLSNLLIKYQLFESIYGCIIENGWSLIGKFSILSIFVFGILKVRLIIVVIYKKCISIWKQ